MDLEKILERVEPIDDMPKEKLLNILREFPELKENLENQFSLNPDWVEKALEGKVFFLAYDDSWKIRCTVPNSINLKFIGLNHIPTIVIDIHTHQKQV